MTVSDPLWSSSSPSGPAPDGPTAPECMHVAIVLYGSRGDIQPGVCLALELQRRGRRVTVLAPPNLTTLADEVGVDHVMPIGLDERGAWSSDEAIAASRRNPLSRWRFAISTIRSGFAAFDDDLIGAFLAEDAPLADVDCLVVAPLCQDRGLALADRLGVEMVVLRHGPMSENGVVGALPRATARWSPAAKRRTWRIADRVTWAATGWNENAFRRRIGLPAQRGPLPGRLAARGTCQIQAFDGTLFDGLSAEWGPTRPIVGFLDLPPENRRQLDEIDADSPDLAAWLSAGDPPVFITFGSMASPAHDAALRCVTRAARRLGRRCLVAGDHRTEPADDGTFVVGAVDHASVLPHCAAAVHHGGAGTTAATLRAGLPTMICAVTADQPLWAHRVRAMGVGAAIRMSALTEDSACVGLGSILTMSVRSSAADLATRMTPPNRSVAAAADIVEERVGVR
ncbi:glycosyltransferase [Gordonia sp. ABSL11-1]|uniref:glycosyltransferase n=1 Tax=Gordonia sp. ABSL11-1 TaxID=3053924 RepID=UPI002573F518|nr:glycosyltransferase [Gordonia sp. ABSL11-1]MDL9945829.1 glycosyltransferase [Gordonia sp. ABSL11-1]